MAPTRRSTACAAPAELSMQQVLEIMRGLQQDMSRNWNRNACRQISMPRMSEMKSSTV